jgi:membrane protein DedA with SNARE-associated domain
MLIADGKLRFLTGWCWLTLGAVLGDVGLYAIGRFLGPRTLSWGFLPQGRMKRAKGWFGKNLVLAVLLSRCIPGTRTPTYIAAGFFGASAVRFLAIDAPAAMVWTFAWLTGLSQLGEAVLPLLGPYKWYILGAAVALIVLAHWLTSRLVQRRLTSAPGDGDSAKEAAGGEPPAKDRQRGA